MSDLSDFDLKQIDLLRPIVKAGAVAHIPFFANTLPLGLHFGLAGEERGADPPNFVDWNTSLGTINIEASHVTVVYTSGADLAKWRIRAKRVGYNLVERLCTVYRPRYLFLGYVPFHEGTFEKDAQPRALDQELVSELRSTYHHIEIYSDTHEQARDLIRGLVQDYSLGPFVRLFESNYAAIGLAAPDARAVAMYFYSAPLTTLLLSERSAYRPINLPDDLLSPNISADTHVCLIHDKAVTETLAEEFVARLREYHENQYSMALNGRGLAFLDACNAYNRFAKNFLLRTVFPSAEAYAECLKRHHDYEQVAVRAPLEAG